MARSVGADPSEMTVEDGADLAAYLEALDVFQVAAKGRLRPTVMLAAVEHFEPGVTLED